MINLLPIEIERLKILLSRSPSRTLTTKETIDTLDILRSKLPELFSGLTPLQLQDNNFLIRHLSNPYNSNKLRDIFQKVLAPDQQNELAEALEQPSVTTERFIPQPSMHETMPIPQETPVTGSATNAGITSMPAMNTPRFSLPRFSTPHIPMKETSSPVATAAAKTQAQISPSPRRLNIPAFRSSFLSGFKSVQNFASPAGPFLKKNLGRVLNGLKGMFGGLGGGFGNIGRGIAGPGLTGTANILGKAGKGGLNLFDNISRPGGFGGGNGISKLSKSSNRVVFGIIGGLLLFVLLSGVMGAITQTTPPGEAAPGPGDIPPSIPGASSAPGVPVGNDFATQLVNKIQESPACGGVITSRNVSACLDSLQPIPALAYQEIIESASNYYYLQCVGFVQAIIGGITGSPLQRVSNAKAFTQAPPPAGYKFVSRNAPGVTIKTGDIAVWSKGRDGHIAYVTDPGNGFTFTVAEANSGSAGSVRTRPVAADEPSFEGWAIKQ